MSVFVLTISCCVILHFLFIVEGYATQQYQSSECQRCGENTRSDATGTHCTACGPNFYSLPGWDTCEERKPCTTDDYVAKYTPCVGGSRTLFYVPRGTLKRTCNPLTQLQPHLYAGNHCNWPTSQNRACHAQMATSSKTACARNAPSKDKWQ